jgi:hypothetical protein
VCQDEVQATNFGTSEDRIKAQGRYYCKICTILKVDTLYYRTLKYEHCNNFKFYKSSFCQSLKTIEYLYYKANDRAASTVILMTLIFILQLNCYGKSERRMFKLNN